MRGIAAAKPGAHVGDIGYAIQSYVEAQRFSVVRDFSGHGLGRIFHDAPNILHYGKKGTGPVLKPGMFFTVEPMVNAGTWQVKILSDGWTAVTRDKQLSAQFEHSVGITETGVEFFTLSPKDLAKPPYDLTGAKPAEKPAPPPDVDLSSGRFGDGDQLGDRFGRQHQLLDAGRCVGRQGDRAVQASAHAGHDEAAGQSVDRLDLLQAPLAQALASGRRVRRCGVAGVSSRKFTAEAGLGRFDAARAIGRGDRASTARDEGRRRRGRRPGGRPAAACSISATCKVRRDIGA